MRRQPPRGVDTEVFAAQRTQSPGGEWALGAGGVGRADPEVQRRVTSPEVDCLLLPSPQAESSMFLLIIFKEPNTIVIPSLSMRTQVKRG